MSDYPRHLHKYPNLWIQVETPEDADARIAEGWSTEQVFDPPTDDAEADPLIEEEPKKRGRKAKA